MVNIRTYLVHILDDETHLSVVPSKTPLFYGLQNFPFDKYSFRHGLWLSFRFPAVCLTVSFFLSFLFLSLNFSHSLYRSNPYRLSIITCVCLLQRNCPNSNRILLISFSVSCMAFFYQIKMLLNLRQTIGKSILFNNNES